MQCIYFIYPPSPLGLLAEMERNKFVPNYITYRSLISAYCANREVHEAKLLIARMIKEGIEPDFKIYLPVLLALRSRANFPSIRNLLAEMRERGIEPDHRVRVFV